MITRIRQCKNGHEKTVENRSKYGQCVPCRRDRDNSSESRKAKNAYMRSKSREYHIKPNHRYNNSASKARRNGRVFTLTLEEYTQLISNPCYYCSKVTIGIEVSCGLDRIDNSKGYETGNILPCCGVCNRHRQDDWTVDEAKAAIKTVLELRRKV